jgi:hypothetical protein
MIMLARRTAEGEQPPQVEHGGSLASPALRGCLVNAFIAAAGNHPLPPGSPPYTIFKTFVFPGPEPFLAAESQVQCRQLSGSHQEER